MERYGNVTGLCGALWKRYATLQNPDPVTAFKFRQGLQKTRVPGLSFGVVSMIIRLAVLTQYRRVTDRPTDT